eukprot:357089-Amorphochlora_amoeboformis.AAC.1
MESWRSLMIPRFLEMVSFGRNRQYPVVIVGTQYNWGFRLLADSRDFTPCHASRTFPKFECVRRV